jgi:hypothetical protein
MLHLFGDEIVDVDEGQLEEADCVDQDGDPHKIEDLIGFVAGKGQKKDQVGDFQHFENDL